MYKYDISSVCKPFKQEELKDGKLFLCIYYVNTSLEIPFLEYLMYKYNEGAMQDTMICPFIEYTKHHSLENHLRMFFTKVFHESIEGQQIEIKGLLGENCLFIDISFFLQNFKKSLGYLKKKVECWWFVSLYEILNTKHIYGLEIHNSVTSLFLDNPVLTRITHNNNLVENPIVLYNGYSYNRCLYVSLFGKNKSFSNAYYGPYYYFTDLNGAKQFALDKQDSSIGIVRSILFINKTKVILNNPNDKKNDLSMLHNLTQKQKELYTRVYNPYGDWAKDYDTLFVYKPILENGTTIQNRLNVVASNSNNTIVLNWVEIELSSKEKSIESVNII